MTVPVFSPPRPAARPRTATRVALIGSGTLLLLAGLFAVLIAAGLMAAFGRASAIDSGSHPVSGSGRAVVADLTGIRNTQDVEVLTGRPTLQVSARTDGTGPVFVGIGPAAAVDRYLDGVATDRLEGLRLDPFTASTSPRPGSASVAPPGDQTFWVTSTATTGDELRWPFTDGDYRVVVMNPDGSADVHATVRFRLVLPHAFGISAGLLAGSVAVAVLGTTLLVSGLRLRPYRTAQ
jgi:hypothetical protein